MADRPRFEKQVIAGADRAAGRPWTASGPRTAEPGRQPRTAGDNEGRGQRPFGAIDLGTRTAERASHGSVHRERGRLVGWAGIDDQRPLPLPRAAPALG